MKLIQWAACGVCSVRVAVAAVGEAAEEVVVGVEGAAEAGVVAMMVVATTKPVGAEAAAATPRVAAVVADVAPLLTMHWWVALWDAAQESLRRRAERRERTALM